MIVVADTNPLIGLAKGKIFYVLRDLYQRVVVPEAVWNELVVSGAGRPGSTEAAAAREWLDVVPPVPVTHPLIQTLNKQADQQCLSIVQNLQADELLTEDAKMRNLAHRLGIQTTYTLDIVILAKQMRLIAACRPVLEQMRNAGFGFTDDRYHQVFAIVGECSKLPSSGWNSSPYAGLTYPSPIWAPKPRTVGDGYDYPA